MGSQRVEHDWMTFTLVRDLSIFHYICFSLKGCLQDSIVGRLEVLTHYGAGRVTPQKQVLTYYRAGRELLHRSSVGDSGHCLGSQHWQRNPQYKLQYPSSPGLLASKWSLNHCLGFAPFFDIWPLAFSLSLVLCSTWTCNSLPDFPSWS